MTQEMHPVSNAPFDAIRHADENGEYWSVRELARMLTRILKYTRYDDIQNAVEHAKEDIEKSGHDSNEHMRKIPQKSTGGRPGSDYELSAFACRLSVMAARTRDADIAARARTYFSDKVEQGGIA